MEFLQEDIIKLGAAIVAGAIIGTEREYRNKTAGFRTITLICFASCLFTILSLKIGSSSPDRIAANIVTGIGFLGAGAIFKEENRIGGLTTAATIWVSAAIGMCLGSGNLVLAAEAVGLIMVILVLLNYVENAIDATTEMHTYTITFTQPDVVMHLCENLLKQHRLKVLERKLHRKGDNYVATWVAVGSKNRHHQFTQGIINHEQVLEFDF
ncbi:MgtC/SapB family protein [Sphingobacteriales bacterium UPWRP_1]|nr:hypothetical protein BVG80_05185 [Sphingobacteriales bacterium TSM_CSM]PSJ76264.1 MgtC/SapB family protein [Sphingobacteriales bacterium UPWRP_1]